MDWTQQMEEMSKQWTDVQKKLWLNWQESASKASSNAQVRAAWQQMLDMWKNTLHRMLDMQVESARHWADSVSSSDVFEGVAQWAEQLHTMTKQSVALQKQMWDGWFQMVEKIDPTEVQGSKDFLNQPVMKLWQEMSQQTMNMQQEWMKNWTAWQPGKKG
ncbi:MAG: hypothetical protein R3C14_17490 [Caldilineaceae bacterium]